MIELPVDVPSSESRGQQASDPVGWGFRGKGAAVKEGMLRSQGRYVFYVDADLNVAPYLSPKISTAGDTKSNSDATRSP